MIRISKTKLAIRLFLCLSFICFASSLTFASSKIFSPTGDMTTTRNAHTATLLGDGKVLVAGGGQFISDSSPLASAELYNPFPGTFTFISNMTAPRKYHTATRLLNGKVLITGGHGLTTLASAELYDSATRSFTATTGNMTTPRWAHTATRLNDGKVLITGGGGSPPLASAEVYDPATDSFTATGAMATRRQYHTATLLNNGMVLITGGQIDFFQTVSSAEVYDPATGPATGSFTATGAMTATRQKHTATILNTGKVLITGGMFFNQNFSLAILSSAEVYDPATGPATGSFTATGNMTKFRYMHVAARLNDGRVLVAGSGNIPCVGADLYDPIAGSFSATGNMTKSHRDYHSATLLKDGSVLIAGGGDTEGNPIAGADIYFKHMALPFSYLLLLLD